jgi:hypothetical protein
VAWTHLREQLDRAECKNDLQAIVMALHNYHDAHGIYPPAFIADDRGRPLHSWRVLILPYFDSAGDERYRQLYDRYDFSEPWNGPHNAQLLGVVPAVYQCPADRRHAAEPTWTSYLAIVSTRTCWPGPDAITQRDILDGASNTLLVVESHHSGIHWMEPRDLHVTQMAPTINARAGQGISSDHAGGAHVTFADGGGRFLRKQLAQETLRRLIERDDGEPVGEF